MSFQENPFIHMSVVTHDDGSTFTWECDSCGGTGATVWDNEPISTLRSIFLAHIRTSHARTEADFEGWT